MSGKDLNLLPWRRSQTPRRSPQRLRWCRGPQDDLLGAGGGVEIEEFRLNLVERQDVGRQGRDGDEVAGVDDEIVGGAHGDGEAAGQDVDGARLGVGCGGGGGGGRIRGCGVGRACSGAVVGCVDEGEGVVGLDAGCEDMVEGGGLPVGGGRVCRDREGVCSWGGHGFGWDWVD